MKVRNETIRLLQRNDVEAYRKLRLLALQESPYSFGSTFEEEVSLTEEEMTQRLGDGENNWVMGAFAEDGPLVGMVGFFRQQKERTRHKGEVWGMYIHPEARGAGLGRKLMKALLAYARTLEGLEQIQLAAVAGNEGAYRLYTALGFQSYGKEPRAAKINGEYQDDVMMVRFL